jgi:hypothetical protein
LIYHVVSGWFHFARRSLCEQSDGRFSPFCVLSRTESSDRGGDSTAKMILRKIGEESRHFSDDIAAPTPLLSKFHRSGQTETAGDDMRETLISKAWNAFSIVRETAGASASRAGTIESDRAMFSEKHD